ncbi:MAG: nucleolar RNA-binding Nop10p family protein [Candidatus Woesearchaeota archaeon]
MKRIKFCEKCKNYTLKDKCPNCSSETILAIPPKFSPYNKYDSYLRKAKEEERKSKGLL